MSKVAARILLAQSEQAAFSPGNTVPGIGLSPDKMLLGRAFAYNDAQRNRIGANFHQLPVNQPKVPQQARSTERLTMRELEELHWEPQPHQREEGQGARVHVIRGRIRLLARA